MDSSEVKIVGLEIGRGKFVGITTSRCVMVESVFAPLKPGRSLDTKKPPQHTLKIVSGKSSAVYVFGVNDVTEHGDPDFVTATNTVDRYGSPDWQMLAKVALFEALAEHIGGDTVSPLIAVTIPIDQYKNDKQNVQERVVDALVEIKQIEDANGHVLKLDIKRGRVWVLPEGMPAFMHYAFDRTLNPRKGSKTVGTTIGIDAGFGTVNVPYFEGMKYQDNQSFTIEGAGFGIVVRAIYDAMPYKVPMARLDLALRALADEPLGKKKQIALPGGTKYDVTEAYDTLVTAQARLITNAVGDRVKGYVDRAVLMGGTSLHLQQFIKPVLPYETFTVSDPVLANAYGLMVALKQRVAAAGKQWV